MQFCILKYSTDTLPHEARPIQRKKTHAKHLNAFIFLFGEDWILFPSSHLLKFIKTQRSMPAKTRKKNYLYCKWKMVRSKPTKNETPDKRLDLRKTSNGEHFKLAMIKHGSRIPPWREAQNCKKINESITYHILVIQSSSSNISSTTLLCPVHLAHSFLSLDLFFFYLRWLDEWNGNPSMALWIKQKQYIFA